MTKKSDKEQKERYAKIWGTPIGQDCISLNQSLAAWLGSRLLFLAQHTTSGAPGFPANEETFEHDREAFLAELTKHGNALVKFGENQDGDEEAQQAMEWVAENFVHLWD